MWSYPVLDPLSQAYPEVEGRSPTCYSPVRRSCTPKGLTARLACVKHAASVRPEPGSNSPTKNIGTNSPSKNTQPHASERPGDSKKPHDTTPTKDAAPTRTNTPNSGTLLSSQRTTTPPYTACPTGKPSGGRTSQSSCRRGPGTTPDLATTRRLHTPDTSPHAGG